MKIFVASTGRCGTMYFYQMFRLFTTIPSYHEPVPWCIGETLRAVNDSDAECKEISEKIEQIKYYSIRESYFESNQMFIKAYVQAVLDSFQDVYCIYLYRNPVDVLISHYKKCKEQEADWILQSHWKKNRLRTQGRLSFYENVLWQSFEVRERYLYYKPAFKRTFEFNFGDINNDNKWEELFDAFGIKGKQPKKKPVLARNELPGDVDACYAKMLKKWDFPCTKHEEKYRAKEAAIRSIEAARVETARAGVE